MKLFLIAGTLCSFIMSCSNEKAEPKGQSEFVKGLFSGQVTNLDIKVFYEPNAIPLTETIPGTANPSWTIALNSLQNLFLNHPGKTVSMPLALTGMIPLPEQAVQIWDVFALISLGQQFQAADSDPTRRTLSVFFLDGVFLADGEAVGAHFDGTPFVFVFKDAIKPITDLKRRTYLEQSTVVHQLGHALGLVNQGIPMAAAHEDSSHRGHTTGADGVMLNILERRTTAMTFVDSALAVNRLNLFGVLSLQDSQNFKPNP